MNRKPTLIIDCDGVLYPGSAISFRDFDNSFTQTVAEYGISERDYNAVCEAAKKRGALGISNLVYDLCQQFNFDFDQFCNDVLCKVDYSGIKPDLELLGLLEEAKKYYNLYILSNNHIGHVDKILTLLFNRNHQNLGIPCYDILSTWVKDKFYGKQTEFGIRHFCEVIGEKPENCTLIDDYIGYLNVAKKTGMNTVWITDGLDLKGYLGELLSQEKIAG